MSLESVLPLPTAPHQLSSARKRTSSFSYPPPSLCPSPRPAKAPKTSMGLSRTQSVIMDSPSPSSSSSSFSSTTVAHYRALSYHRDSHRLKRKNAVNKVTQEPLTINTQTGSKYTTVFTTPTTTRTPSATSSLSSAVVPVPLPASLKSRPSRSTNPFAAINESTPSAPPASPVKKAQRAPQVILPSASCPITTRVTPRTSSPLAPTPKSINPRPVFPRSKAEPDLYKTALKGCLKKSPDGQRVLHMGARLAMSIFVATRELERLVAMDSFRDAEGDVTMGDAWGDEKEKDEGCLGLSLCGAPAQPVLTSSWVVVRGDDWEMVDCAA
ncbi:hypothetical protein BJ165DRAFT_1056749 [Panaeolus papilionaceus]|nr:hypothetical protein BJ165DRAFT_1056749 [Panaeolus papilionaceus]